MFDIFTFEIIRSNLYAIAREMKISMVNAASSDIIYYGGDCSAAIFDSHLNLVAQGNDIPTMLGANLISVVETLRSIDPETIAVGDVFLSNDPYSAGGNHLNDVLMIKPVFFQNNIIAYTTTRGHWIDIGGQAAASYSGNAADIWGEGLRIPPVRIFKAGQFDAEMASVLLTNTRQPDSRLIDLNAQFSGVYQGEQRLLNLIEKYGIDYVMETFVRTLDYSEVLMREAIKKIPDGTYEGIDYVEGFEGEASVRIQARITVKESAIEFDYQGSQEQVGSGINSAYSATVSATYYFVRAITDYKIPINSGCYRPVTVRIPRGSVLNPVSPAPVVLGVGETGNRIVDMLLSILAQAIPQKVIAGSSGTAGVSFISGVVIGKNQDKRDYRIVFDIIGGGMGARSNQDGVNSIRVHIGNTGSQSVEAVERNNPVFIEKWNLVTDSGGAGKYRGGLASVRVTRSLFEEAEVTVGCERAKVPSMGLFGGQCGSLGKYSVHRDKVKVRDLGSKSFYKILKNDTIYIQPAGGGGYGYPFDRSAYIVLSDVRNEYVSFDASREVYGVVITDKWEVDEQATFLLREKMRSEQILS